MSRRLKFLAVLVGGGLFIFLALVLVQPRTVTKTMDLRVAGTSQPSNGILLVTVTLRNGTSRYLNVVDDASGNPAFLLDTGSQRGTWLTTMVNQLKINLAPGASMTNTVVITNPPPRFRLKVPVRDLAAESWGSQASLFLPRAVARVANVPRRWLLRKRLHISPASEWIRQAPPNDG